jgi:hypothetical protein
MTVGDQSTVMGCRRQAYQPIAIVLAELRASAMTPAMESGGIAIPVTPVTTAMIGTQRGTLRAFNADGCGRAGRCSVAVWVPLAVPVGAL